MPELDAALAEKIAEFESQSRLRTLSTHKREGANVWRGERKLISFSCNDYFGLAQDYRIIDAAADAAAKYGAGAASSRLITGNHPLYEPLEKRLAKWKKTQAATLFGSGYLANLGTIPALVGRDDLILADKLSHACMLDGARLSGAKLLRFNHNDVAHAAEFLKARGEYKNCLILTETVFSMDGDRAPLAELRELADAHDAWLMTDDAHGFGIVKDNPAHIQMGTLSKGIGSYGGYVAGSATLIRYLETTARSLMFSTALPPANIAAAQMALSILEIEPQRIALPLELAKYFAEALHLPEAQSCIVPLMLGDEQTALDASKRLEAAGFLVAAIRPPTVPEGSARLRFSFSANHTTAQVEALIHEVQQHVYHVSA